jgi:hypothetical protein
MPDMGLMGMAGAGGVATGLETLFNQRMEQAKLAQQADEFTRQLAQQDALTRLKYDEMAQTARDAAEGRKSARIIASIPYLPEHGMSAATRNELLGFGLPPEMFPPDTPPGAPSAAGAAAGSAPAPLAPLTGLAPIGGAGTPGPVPSGVAGPSAGLSPLGSLSPLGDGGGGGDGGVTSPVTPSAPPITYGRTLSLAERKEKEKETEEQKKLADELAYEKDPNVPKEMRADALFRRLYGGNAPAQKQPIIRESPEGLIELGEDASGAPEWHVIPGPGGKSMHGVHPDPTFVYDATDAAGNPVKVVGSKKVGNQVITAAKARPLPYQAVENVAGLNTAEVEGVKVLRALHSTGADQSNDPLDPRWQKFLATDLKVSGSDYTKSQLQQRVAYVNAALLRRLLGGRPNQYTAQLIEQHLPKGEMTGSKLAQVMSDVLEQTGELRTETAQMLPGVKGPISGQSYQDYLNELAGGTGGATGPPKGRSKRDVDQILKDAGITKRP